MTTELPDQSNSEVTPTQKKTLSRGGKIGMIVGFSCLGTLLLPILIIASLINGNKAMVYTPDPDERTVELAPLAAQYQSQVKKNFKLLPSFQSLTVAVYNRGLPCLESYESPDTCLLTETKSFNKRQDEAICAEVLSFAKELGATEDSIPGAAKMVKLSSDSQTRCESVLSLYPRSVGWGWFSPDYYLQGEASNGAPFAIQLSFQQISPIDFSKEMPEPSKDTSKLAVEKFKYSLVTSTNYDTPDPIDNLPNYSDGKTQVAAMLDTFAYYRRSNPGLPIFDPTFARSMINQYKSTFNFDGLVEEHVDPKGEVHWIHFVSSDKVNVCVSVGASVKELTTEDMETGNPSMLDVGIPNGLVELSGLQNEVTSMASKHVFGDYMNGSCK